MKITELENIIHAAPHNNTKIPGQYDWYRSFAWPGYKLTASGTSADDKQPDVNQAVVKSTENGTRITEKAYRQLLAAAKVALAELKAGNLYGKARDLLEEALNGRIQGK